MLSLGTKSSPAKKSAWPIVLPLAFIIAIVFVAGGYVLAMALLPSPEPTVTQKIKPGPIDTGKLAQISWPFSQQAAIGAVGNDVVVVGYEEEKALPIASVAKIITALAVLKQKPLELDKPGPTIKLTASDVSLYNSYKSKGGSVVKVAANEEISQYQALQAMLIPSANNMAASLANWAFGSEAKYVEYANKMVAELGLSSTKVDDASGLSPKTVSSARDLVILGKEALNNPVIAQIVGQTKATIPVAGEVQTTNSVIGQSGINGMKTGHTNEAGGCFLFTATHETDGKSATVVGAIVGAPSKEEAIEAAPSVVEQGLGNLVAVTALDDGMIVGTMQVPWASSVPVVAEKGLSEVAWRGSEVALKLDLAPGYEAGKVGTARLTKTTTNLLLKSPLPQADLWWRLTHPQEILAALSS